MDNVNDIVNGVISALKQEGINPHITKTGEWGLINFKLNKSDSLCLGSFNKDTFIKAKKIVQNNITKDFLCRPDNYYTLFIKRRNKH